MAFLTDSALYQERRLRAMFACLLGNSIHRLHRFMERMCLSPKIECQSPRVMNAMVYTLAMKLICAHWWLALGARWLPQYRFVILARKQLPSSGLLVLLSPSDTTVYQLVGCW